MGGGALNFSESEDIDDDGSYAYVGRYESDYCVDAKGTGQAIPNCDDFEVQKNCLTDDGESG